MTSTMTPVSLRIGRIPALTLYGLVFLMLGVLPASLIIFPDFPRAPVKEELRTFVGTPVLVTKHLPSRSSGLQYSLKLKSADGEIADFSIQEWAVPLVEQRLARMATNIPITIKYEMSLPVIGRRDAYEASADGVFILKFEDATRARKTYRDQERPQMLRGAAIMLLFCASILWAFFRFELPVLHTKRPSITQVARS